MFLYIAVIVGAGAAATIWYVKQRSSQVSKPIVKDWKKGAVVCY